MRTFIYNTIYITGVRSESDFRYISPWGIGKTNKTPIIYGLVGFLGFDYILSQMFYGAKVNLCVCEG